MRAHDQRHAKPEGRRGGGAEVGREIHDTEKQNRRVVFVNTLAAFLEKHLHIFLCRQVYLIFFSHRSMPCVAQVPFHLTAAVAASSSSSSTFSGGLEVPQRVYVTKGSRHYICPTYIRRGATAVHVRRDAGRDPRRKNPQTLALSPCLICVEKQTPAVYHTQITRRRVYLVKRSSIIRCARIYTYI